MSYNHLFRISVHAVITDDNQNVLLLKQTYDNERWGLPGGAPEPPETIQATLIRECKEELNCDIEIKYLSGVYYHQKHSSYVFIYRCSLAKDSVMQLSGEHSDYRYHSIDELSDVQRQRVKDCLDYTGEVRSAVF
ncbi:MAG: NUDIX domain-containing protein [Patescibacteria group bacterium]|jgi:8-oxo-dGTP pyrophosphatase MutT (NUDIX family)